MKTISRLVDDAVALNKRINRLSSFPTIGMARRFARRVIARDEYENDIEALLNEHKIPKTLVYPLADILYEQVTDDD